MAKQKHPQNGGQHEHDSGQERQQDEQEQVSAGSSRVKISGVIFDAPQPYLEGHVCNSAEAHTLNQTLRENLRNNFTGQVDAVKEKAVKERGEGATLTEHELAALAAKFAEYSSSYRFGERKAGVVTLDPIERESRKIARGILETAIREKGAEKPPKEKMEDLISQLVEKNPAIGEEAKRRVAAVQAAASVSLGDLGLGA